MVSMVLSVPPEEGYTHCMQVRGVVQEVATPIRLCRPEAQGHREESIYLLHRTFGRMSFIFQSNDPDYHNTMYDDNIYRLCGVASIFAHRSLTTPVYVPQ
jgi:hypothetical protein